MLTSQMPALTRAMAGVLPPLALKQLTQALGNCNQELTHRGQLSFAPDGWQNAINQNGQYTSFPPTAGQYNQFYNDIVNEGDNFFNNVNNVNNNSYNTNNEFITQIFQGGPPGRDGRDGLDGLIGRDGINGIDGERGAAGAAGDAGAAGAAGPAGAPGNPGAAGGNGRDGRDGAAGQAGAAGAAGNDGAAGQNGRDGRDGKGVDSLKLKPFVSTIQPTTTPVVADLETESFQVLTGVTFNESTCQLEYAFATVRGVKTLTNSRALASVREIPDTAYGP